MNKLLTNDSDDKQIDILFKHIDDLLLNNQFELVDSFIATYDVNYAKPYMLVSLLSITKAAKDRLPNRDDLVDRIYSRLDNDLGLEKAAKLIHNLI